MLYVLSRRYGSPQPFGQTAFAAPAVAECVLIAGLIDIFLYRMQ
jgi:hypothetical protein